MSACVPKNEPAATPATKAVTDYKVNVDDIHNLLVANIAYHNNADEIALNALAKVARNSRNPNLLEDAISLAYRMEKPELMLELNTILLEVEPKNPYARINSTWHYFRAGQSERGIESLITYLKNLNKTNADEIRNATSVILAQDRDTQDSILYELTHTKHVNTYLTAAIIYGLIRRDDLHIKWLDKTLTLEPALEYAAILKLDHYLKQNQSQPETLVDFTHAHLKKNPEHIRFRMLYASYLIDIQKYENAIDQLEHVVAYEPKHESAYYIMGLTHLQNNENTQAVKAFNKSLKINPNNDQTRFYLADAYENINQHDKAINVLNGITTDKDYFDAQLRIGAILAKSTSLEKGIEYLQNIDTHSNNEKLAIIATTESLYRENKKWRDALEILNIGLQQFPNNLDLLYSRGYVNAVLQNIKKHEEDMRKIIAIDPQRADAYNALGYTLADQTQRYDEALKLIEKANELNPDNPYILDSLGWVHYRLGKNDIALEYLLKAFALLKDAEIAVHIGEVFWQLGNKQQAQRYWQKAEEIDPQNDSLKDTRQRFISQD